MSSVLIGIIGVALFMGIAIGCAIFLGPQFDDAQTLSLGSTVIQRTSEVASAVNSYRMANSYSYGPGLSTVQSLVTAGFLDEVPDNPVVAARLPQIVNPNGLAYPSVPSADRATWTPRFAFMSVGTDQSVCTAAERAAGNLSSTEVVSTDQLDPAIAANKNAGCFRSSVNTVGVALGEYVVYARI